jgi:hypothetical protein
MIPVFFEFALFFLEVVDGVLGVGSENNEEAKNDDTDGEPVEVRADHVSDQVEPVGEEDVQNGVQTDVNRGDKKRNRHHGMQDTLHFVPFVIGGVVFVIFFVGYKVQHLICFRSINDGLRALLSRPTPNARRFFETTPNRGFKTLSGCSQCKKVPPFFLPLKSGICQPFRSI